MKSTTGKNGKLALIGCKIVLKLITVLVLELFYWAILKNVSEKHFFNSVAI